MKLIIIIDIAPFQRSSKRDPCGDQWLILGLGVSVARQFGLVSRNKV